MNNLFRNLTSSAIKSCKWNILESQAKCLFLKQSFLVGVYSHNLTFSHLTRRNYATLRLFATKPGIQDNISSLQLKKRTVRKKKAIEDEEKPPGMFNVVAFATSEEYDLEALIKGLKEQGLYDAKAVKNNSDAVHALAKIRVEEEPREIFFFREGGVVFWNVTDLESSNVLGFLRKFEQDGYSEQLVIKESEIMNYKHWESDSSEGSCLSKSGDFHLSAASENLMLDKYTFSNAMSLSVKLGIWEALLEKYIDSIEGITEDLKMGRKIRISREEAMRKHGELFALRHLINLSSDLLDTPDFYWENEQLEALYIQICNYFGISKRTRVMNEKINHCVELIELISSHLNDKHHIRLEWMIIILIMVEVGFETIHYLSR